MTDADPCQARAVRLARRARGLVIHGPPGTGKSQTIANIVGDHLARGERVLFVCDKRTALDVVHQRISHLGLGLLCAVVHDAHRTSAIVHAGCAISSTAWSRRRRRRQAAAELETVDAELTRLHAELLGAERSLAERPGGGREPSSHELAGRWLELAVAPALGKLVGALDEPPLASLPTHERAAREVLERSAKEGWPTNPWRQATGVELGPFLARPQAEWREGTAALVQAARAADETASPRIPPFAREPALAQQGAARAQLSRDLAPVVADLSDEALGRWGKATPGERKMTKEALKKLAGERDVLARGPLDPSLAPLHEGAKVPLGQVTLEVVKLKDYLEAMKRWWSFVAFSAKSAAAPIVARYGLTLSPAEATRVLELLEGVRARAILADFHKKLAGTKGDVADELLAKTLTDWSALFDLLERLGTEPALASVAPAVREALGDRAKRADLLAGLLASEARAAALARFESALPTPLLAAASRAQLAGDGRAGAAVLPPSSQLDERLGSVEGILRLRAALATVPAKMQERLVALAELGASADEGSRAIARASTRPRWRAGCARRRLWRRSTPRGCASPSSGSARSSNASSTSCATPSATAGRRASSERLLASTGSRLGSAGAELKRRLALRGERALKLRPMIAAGAGSTAAIRSSTCGPCGWRAPRPSPRSSRAARSSTC